MCLNVEIDLLTDHRDALDSPEQLLEETVQYRQTSFTRLEILMRLFKICSQFYGFSKGNKLLLN